MFPGLVQFTFGPVKDLKRTMIGLGSPLDLRVATLWQISMSLLAICTLRTFPSLMIFSGRFSSEDSEMP